jgi:hypothetical protein
MNDQHENANKKFNLLRDHLTKIQKALEDERISREHMSESKAKDIQGFENKLLQILEMESLQRKDNENKLLRMLDDRSGAIKHDI